MEVSCKFYPGHHIVIRNAQGGNMHQGRDNRVVLDQEGFFGNHCKTMGAEVSAQHAALFVVAGQDTHILQSHLAGFYILYLLQNGILVAGTFTFLVGHIQKVDLHIALLLLVVFLLTTFLIKCLVCGVN